MTAPKSSPRSCWFDSSIWASVGKKSLILDDFGHFKDDINMSNQSIFSMLYGVHSESSSFHPDFARLRALRLSTSRLWRQNFRRFWSKVVLFFDLARNPHFFLGWLSFLLLDLSSRTLLVHVSEQPGCSWRIVIPSQSAMMLLA